MLTDHERLRICQLRADGLPYARIANMLGVSETTASRVGRDVPTGREKTGYMENEECRKIFRRIKRAAIRCTEAARKGEMKPCEHCRWRMNKAPRPVCVACYRQRFAAAGARKE